MNIQTIIFTIGLAILLQSCTSPTRTIKDVVIETKDITHDYNANESKQPNYVNTKWNVSDFIYIEDILKNQNAFFVDLNIKHLFGDAKKLNAAYVSVFVCKKYNNNKILTSMLTQKIITQIPKCESKETNAANVKISFIELEESNAIKKEFNIVVGTNYFELYQFKTPKLKQNKAMYEYLVDYLFRLTLKSNEPIDQESRGEWLNKMNNLCKQELGKECVKDNKLIWL